MQTATHAQEVIEPELMIECTCVLEELRLPTIPWRTSQWLVEADACRGAVQLWELALLGDAEEHFHFHAEGIANLCALTRAVLAELLTLTRKIGIADVPDKPSTANAILEPPTIFKHGVAIQGGVIQLSFAFLAKRRHLDAGCVAQELRRSGLSLAMLF